MEPDRDTDAPVDALTGQPIGGVFKIEYVDAGGEISERVIERCRLVIVQPHEYVLAHCRLRNGDRLFRLDRVRSVVDEVSGEVMATLGGSPYGASYEPVIVLHDSDDPSSAARFDLDVLTFVASLSSKMRESQVKILSGYLVEHCGLDATADLARMVKKHRVPGPEAFRQAMKSVPGSRADALLLTARELLQKVKRNGPLDQGVMAMLEARKVYIGKYDGL